MVGMTQFVNPSPNWKACTATCLVIPVKSAIGTMIGITAAAWPEPEEMKKLIRALARNMKPAPKTAPMWLIGFASQYTIVSRIMPLLMRTVRQFAKPTMKAAPTVLAQPLMKRLKPHVYILTAYTSDQEANHQKCCRNFVRSPFKLQCADYNRSQTCHHTQHRQYLNLCYRGIT